MRKLILTLSLLAGPVAASETAAGPFKNYGQCNVAVSRMAMDAWKADRTRNLPAYWDAFPYRCVNISGNWYIINFKEYN